MKNIFKQFISLISPKDTFTRNDYLVVDSSKYRDDWIGLFNGTRIVAYKCDEFETEKDALEYIDRRISKEDRCYVQLYKLVPLSEETN